MNAQTLLDARRSSALARALGATSRQVGTGLAMAQVFPALAGALLGIPGGVGRYDAEKRRSHDGPAGVVARRHGPRHPGHHCPADRHPGARRPVAEMLRAETT
jgi:hypothetical protein